MTFQDVNQHITAKLSKLTVQDIITYRDWVPFALARSTIAYFNDWPWILLAVKTYAGKSGSCVLLM